MLIYILCKCKKKLYTMYVNIVLILSKIICCSLLLIDACCEATLPILLLYILCSLALSVEEYV